MEVTTLAKIACPWCGQTTYNPRHIQERYCANCHLWHKDMQRMILSRRENCRYVVTKEMLAEVVESLPGLKITESELRRIVVQVLIWQANNPRPEAVTDEDHTAFHAKLNLLLAEGGANTVPQWPNHVPHAADCECQGCLPQRLAEAREQIRKLSPPRRPHGSKLKLVPESKPGKLHKGV